MSVLKLIGEPKSTAATAGQRLAQRVYDEVPDAAKQQNLIELVATTLVYKYTDRDRSEIEAMLMKSDLRQTRFFQEAKEEGLEEGIERGLEEGIEQGMERAMPLMLRAKVSLSEIALEWSLSEATVERMAIASLHKTNTPPAAIAKQLNLSLTQVQGTIDSLSD